MKVPALVALLLFAKMRLPAEEFSIHTVDGLNRALAGVQVEVECATGIKVKVRLHLKSDSNGEAHGIYNSAQCKPLTVKVAKQGYNSYSSGFRERYVLERQFSTEEVDRIAKSDGDDQLHGLRELLAGSAEQFQDTLFFYEARLRPALRALSREPEATTPARRILSLIGVSEDLHLIMQLAPPVRDSDFS
jgi:hypothetical protein